MLFLVGTTLASAPLQDVTYRGELAKRYVMHARLSPRRQQAANSLALLGARTRHDVSADRLDPLQSGTRGSASRPFPAGRGRCLVQKARVYRDRSICRCSLPLSLSLIYTYLLHHVAQLAAHLYPDQPEPEPAIAGSERCQRRRFGRVSTSTYILLLSIFLHHPLSHLLHTPA